MSDQPKQGYLEAHTRGETAGDRVAQAQPELGGTDPASLLAGLPEEEAADLLELVAETALSARRGPGRPAGATNRKNADTIAYLAARGHRDPWVTLSLIQSADFAALCQMVGATKAKEKLAILKLQRDAANDIMGYHHAKKPQQLDLPAGATVRPVIAIGAVNISQRNDGTGAIDLLNLGAVQVEKPNEINGSVVREDDDAGSEVE